jgi:ABC-2 type transport system ATP-binding protein
MVYGIALRKHCPADEPTTGLDPQARANLWTHISDLRVRRGNTVFLTTHYLEEADALCDRVLIIDKGTIVADDTPDVLKRKISGDLVEAIVSDSSQASTTAEHFSRVAFESTVSVEDTKVSGRFANAGSELTGLLRSLDSAGVSVTSIEVRRPTLDDVFLTLTGRSLREEA